jgi:hypothetical protein
MRDSKQKAQALFESVPESELAHVPRVTEDQIRAALVRGEQDRRLVEDVSPPSAASLQLMYR